MFLACKFMLLYQYCNVLVSICRVALASRDQIPTQLASPHWKTDLKTGM